MGFFLVCECESDSVWVVPQTAVKISLRSHGDCDRLVHKVAPVDLRVKECVRFVRMWGRPAQVPTTEACKILQFCCKYSLYTLAGLQQIT